METLQALSIAGGDGNEEHSLVILWTMKELPCVLLGTYPGDRQGHAHKKACMRACINLPYSKMKSWNPSIH